MTAFYLFADPSHAWLKVPRKLLINLNIANQITPYSYQRGDYAYLEEDCDLSSFVKAMTTANKKYVIKHRYTDRLSRIRNYEYYRP